MATKQDDTTARKYEQTRNPGADNDNGKASATRAGGDPVTSPVIGNPGESDPAAGNYDYGLAGALQGQANPKPVAPPAAPVAQEVVVPYEYAFEVRARQKGEYDGIKEVGEVFDNTKNLPTYPEDRNSWFEDAAHAVEEAPKRRTRPAR